MGKRSRSVPADPAHAQGRPLKSALRTDPDPATTRDRRVSFHRQATMRIVERYAHDTTDHVSPSSEVKSEDDPNASPTEEIQIKLAGSSGSLIEPLDGATEEPMPFAGPFAFVASDSFGRPFTELLPQCDPSPSFVRGARTECFNAPRSNGAPAPPVCRFTHPLESPALVDLAYQVRAATFPTPGPTRLETVAHSPLALKLESPHLALNLTKVESPLVRPPLHLVLGNGSADPVHGHHNPAFATSAAAQPPADNPALGSAAADRGSSDALVPPTPQLSDSSPPQVPIADAFGTAPSASAELYREGSRLATQPPGACSGNAEYPSEARCDENAPTLPPSNPTESASPLEPEARGVTQPPLTGIPGANLPSFEVQGLQGDPRDETGVAAQPRQLEPTILESPLSVDAQLAGSATQPPPERGPLNAESNGVDAQAMGTGMGGFNSQPTEGSCDGGNRPTDIPPYPPAQEIYDPGLTLQPEIPPAEAFTPAYFHNSGFPFDASLPHPHEAIPPVLHAEPFSPPYCGDMESYLRSIAETSASLHELVGSEYGVSLSEPWHLLQDPNFPYPLPELGAPGNGTQAQPLRTGDMEILFDPGALDETPNGGMDQEVGHLGGQASPLDDGHPELNQPTSIPGVGREFAPSVERAGCSSPEVGIVEGDSRHSSESNHFAQPLNTGQIEILFTPDELASTHPPFGVGEVSGGAAHRVTGPSPSEGARVSPRVSPRAMPQATSSAPSSCMTTPKVPLGGSSSQSRTRAGPRLSLDLERFFRARHRASLPAAPSRAPNFEVGPVRVPERVSEAQASDVTDAEPSSNLMRIVPFLTSIDVMKGQAPEIPRLPAFSQPLREPTSIREALLWSLKRLQAASLRKIIDGSMARMQASADELKALEREVNSGCNTFLFEYSYCPAEGQRILASKLRRNRAYFNRAGGARWSKAYRRHMLDLETELTALHNKVIADMQALADSHHHAHSLHELAKAQERAARERLEAYVSSQESQPTNQETIDKLNYSLSCLRKQAKLKREALANLRRKLEAAKGERQLQQTQTELLNQQIELTRAKIRAVPYVDPQAVAHAKERYELLREVGLWVPEPGSSPLLVHLAATLTFTFPALPINPGAVQITPSHPPCGSMLHLIRCYVARLPPELSLKEFCLHVGRVWLLARATLAQVDGVQKRYPAQLQPLEDGYQLRVTFIWPHPPVCLDVLFKLAAASLSAPPPPRARFHYGPAPLRSRVTEALRSLPVGSTLLDACRVVQGCILTA